MWPFKRPSPASAPGRLIDGVRIAADLRDRAGVLAEYRRIPPVVVADILRRAGVAAPRTAEMTDGARRHLDGSAFLALAIARDAGFDATAVTVAVLSDQLEGDYRDRHSPDPADGYAPADPEF